MNITPLLAKHKFQFISFLDVYHLTAFSGRISINDDHHVIHVIRGTGTVTINKITYPLIRGSIIAIPPFVEFILEGEPDFAMRNIHYRLWFSDGKPVEHHWMLPLVFSPGYFSHTESLLNDLYLLVKAKRETQPKFTVLAHEIILDHWLWAETYPKRSEIIDHRMEKIHNLLLSPEYNQYDAQDLSNVSCLSISQMNRLFKRIFKCSPQKYWEANRLAVICVTLKNSDGTIGEIADAFGFSSLNYFSRWFKKRTSFAPVEYRERADAL